MSDEFAFDVFLSHSSKDKAVVRALAERLRVDGLRVWFDEWAIKVGDNIPAKIEEGLENSRVMVLCMSEQAFGSDWAQLEAGTFRFRDPLNKERRFVPLRLDEAPIKGSLAQFSYINWPPPTKGEDRKQEYAKLVEACQLPSKSVTADPGSAGEQLVRKVVQLNYKNAMIVACEFRPDRMLALTGSLDKTARLWDLETGRCLRVLEGHTQQVWCVALSRDALRALSGSRDGTVRLWDLQTGSCLRVFEGNKVGTESVAFSPDERAVLTGSFAGPVSSWDVERGVCERVLKGHIGFVASVEWSSNQQRALSSSRDKTARLWSLKTGICLRVFSGHTDCLVRATWSADERYALSSSWDKTVRVWDVQTGRCLHVLEGHTNIIMSVKWSSDQRLALSGSLDKTVRLWNVQTGRCLLVLEGHADRVYSVAWSADQRLAFSADRSGEIRLWNLQGIVTNVPSSKPGASATPPALDQIQYTNAKVLLVGDTSAGKTGLTERLVHDRSPQRGPSTCGTWSTQWPLKDVPQKPGWEREVWLWDFGGQADQRLIHQLYLDRAGLVLLMFDADRETVLPGLREWHQALARSAARDARRFLVAGRTDAGCRFDREKVRAFAKQNGYEYFETSAETGSGIPELRRAMVERIPWDNLARHNSPALFKRLKDEILKLRYEGQVLITLKEMESLLRLRLPADIKFADAHLETVVSLLDGPGLVKELGFGTYILLRPEWINIYAQAVIRTLRAAEGGLGSLPVSSIAEGKLIFQSREDGKGEAEKRLSSSDEKVVLQAMEEMLLERRLCLRQNGDLVFPSQCGLERPIGPVPPKFFVSYTISGFLDDIYATLVVKLAHCGAFRMKESWRDAADFETLADGKTVGVKLVRRDDGCGELLAHHAPGVTGQEQVIFANYIHEHLSEKSTEEVPRLRFYACPNCDEPVENRKLAMERLERDGEQAQIRCQRCDKFVSLWDILEKRFASEAIRKKVEALRQHESSDLDSRRQGKLLVHEVAARVTSANQKCHETPGDEDEGIDLTLEFTDTEGSGTGKHMYLQLKAGNSYLKKRKRDGAEVFTIKKQRWVKQWICQDGPMMLVIGTFSEEPDRADVSEKKSFAQVRWMEIGELLRKQSDNGKKPVKQIVFDGDRIDTLSVRRWRDKVLGLGVP